MISARCSLLCAPAFALAIACGDDASPSRPPPADAGCTECGGCSEAVPVRSFLHVVGPIEYADSPPASGDHDPCWARWGVHESVVLARNWVHNLEHGGVVFLYDCPDGCEDEVAELRALVEANPRTLLTRYPELPTRFAAVSWGHRLLSDCADRSAFQSFYDSHFDRGRESIGSDPPASCSAASSE